MSATLFDLLSARPPRLGAVASTCSADRRARSVGPWRPDAFESIPPGLRPLLCDVITDAAAFADEPDSARVRKRVSDVLTCREYRAPNDEQRGQLRAVRRLALDPQFNLDSMYQAAQRAHHHTAVALA
jgi:hypothetical protein